MEESCKHGVYGTFLYVSGICVRKLCCITLEKHMRMVSEW